MSTHTSASIAAFGFVRKEGRKWRAIIYRTNGNICVGQFTKKREAIAEVCIKRHLSETP